MKSLLEDHFSDWQKGNPDLNKTHTIQRSEDWFHYFEKEDALQSAIRIGKPLFNRSHKDFTEMMVVNTILGGYFGSRLMNNIREDKGYTYGIGSAIASFNHSGYFFITSEVGADVTQNTLDEVNKEINILRDELVGQEELQLVRNYMIGSFMRSIDGPFALSDKYRILLDYNMNFDYYKNFIETVKTIEAERIMELAQIHFDPKSMYTIVAGKKNKDIYSIPNEDKDR
jgi:predicted Zn-dependent peptidase